MNHEGDASGSRSKIVDMELNVRAVLAMQQLGVGQRGLETIGGLLGINGMAARWFTAMEECVGLIQIALTKEIIQENLLLESDLSPWDPVHQCHGLSVAMDAGWTNRGNGKSYNSDSCQHITIGNRTQKVVGLQYLSRCCAKCMNRGKEIGNNLRLPCSLLCSRNYSGSSKGMESYAALETTKAIWDGSGKNICIREIVIDDDTTTKKLLTKSISELLLAGILDEWPRTLHTKVPRKVKDSGRLPLDHPELIWLSDINHRLRCKSRREFALARAPIRVSRVTLMDAYRMKRNMCFAVFQHAALPFGAFKRQCKAVLEHHFGEHSGCGKWCPFLKCNGNKQKESLLYYRDKQKDYNMYVQLKEIHDVFTSDEALSEIHHRYSTNKCESLNKFITKFVRKDGHRCRTICAKARAFVAVGVDSCGYSCFYRRLFSKLGIRYDNVIQGSDGLKDKR